MPVLKFWPKLKYGRSDRSVLEPDPAAKWLVVLTSKLRPPASSVHVASLRRNVYFGPSRSSLKSLRLTTAPSELCSRRSVQPSSLTTNDRRSVRATRPCSPANQMLLLEKYGLTDGV